MIDSFINEKEFESYKERVRQIINANDLSTAELYARYSYEIIYRICMFDRVKILLSKISNITFSDLKNFINKYINTREKNRTNYKRRKRKRKRKRNRGKRIWRRKRRRRTQSSNN